MPRLIVFDLDGTLTDPREGITRCIRHAFAAVGEPCPSDDVLLQWIGPPLQRSFSDHLGEEAAHLVPSAIAAYRERFASLGMYENAVYPGIREALVTLRDVGWRLYVATSVRLFKKYHEDYRMSPYKPDTYNSVSPYLVVDGANATIEFLKQVFGAQELRRYPGDAGKVLHAEVRLDDTVVTAPTIQGMIPGGSGLIEGSFTVDSATQITAITPAHAAGAVDVAVTTPGGTTTLAGAFTYAAPVSTDASLASLAVSTGTLDPAFATGITSYALDVPNAASSITVTPTATDGSASLTVDGAPLASGAASAPIALAVGDTTIAIVVTAEDGITTQTYTIVVTRAVATPTLASLTPATGTTAGGTSVVLTGADLTDDDETSAGQAADTPEGARRRRGRQCDRRCARWRDRRPRRDRPFGRVGGGAHRPWSCARREWWNRGTWRRRGVRHNIIGATPSIIRTITCQEATMHRASRGLLLLIVVLISAACMGRADPGGPRSQSDAITVAEIDRRGPFNSMYEMIQILRPRWVRSSGPDTFVGPAGQVPQQPADGVRLRVEPDGQVLHAQSVGGAVHGLLDAAVGVEEQIGRGAHEVPSSRFCSVSQSVAMVAESSCSPTLRALSAMSSSVDSSSLIGSSTGARSSARSAATSGTTF